MAPAACGGMLHDAALQFGCCICCIAASCCGRLLRSLLPYELVPRYVYSTPPPCAPSYVLYSPPRPPPPPRPPADAEMSFVSDEGEGAAAAAPPPPVGAAEWPWGRVAVGASDPASSEARFEAAKRLLLRAQQRNRTAGPEYGGGEDFLPRPRHLGTEADWHRERVFVEHTSGRRANGTDRWEVKGGRRGRTLWQIGGMEVRRSYGRVQVLDVGTGVEVSSYMHEYRLQGAAAASSPRVYHLLPPVNAPHPVQRRAAAPVDVGLDVEVRDGTAAAAAVASPRKRPRHHQPTPVLTHLVKYLRAGHQPGSHTNSIVSVLAAAALVKDPGLLAVLQRHTFILGQHANQFASQLTTEAMVALIADLDPPQ
jgi:hypothetical protein